MGRDFLAIGLTLLLGTLGIGVNEPLQNSTSKGTEILYCFDRFDCATLALFIPLGVNFVFGRFASLVKVQLITVSCAILLDIGSNKQRCYNVEANEDFCRHFVAKKWLFRIKSIRIESHVSASHSAQFRANGAKW